VASAAALAEDLVAPLGRRWDHVRSVAARAVELKRAVPKDDGDVLVASAWLHDVGYAEDLALTRFHPLDGARYLRENSWPARLVNLVAHHSGARYEAAERGLEADLAEFELETGPVMDALVTADLTVGPGGERVTYRERIGEILERYEPDSPVHKAWLKAADPMEECIKRTMWRQTVEWPNQ
jgi:hypothetical protein